ncbi:hypothetical protein GCM10023224_39550 [Streptomonospora halophila]|uniref:Restriction endonuclease n=1 Tax=Streptomonospora halophila TaxID=427369 RepID=A0ABP9GRI4_9ACTN
MAALGDDRGVGGPRPGAQAAAVRAGGDQAPLAVENEDGRPVVYVYELDPATGAYVASGIHRDRLKLAVPFDIDVDLTAIDDM